MAEDTEEKILFAVGDDYEFPKVPFESIGLSLSGGGFRAAAYGLGVLSVLDALKLNDIEGREIRLLDNVNFISSASGGTIALLTYTAALRKGIPFQDYFCHLNLKITGECLLQDALDTLRDSAQWNVIGKARNPINSFARVYHSSLFDFLSPEERDLSFIMQPISSHIGEFCFNASEFYTGLSFRFQGANKDWQYKTGGRFGNSNIGINWKAKVDSITTLKQIRLGDILAASSCFPLGFEPIIYPRDFTYEDGPTIKALKEALKIETYSWSVEEEHAVSNLKSKRAKSEKEFADAGEFGLMDGGICDNQGLYSLLEANKRKTAGPAGSQGPHNRFDLMIVSDVTSFYMNPFKEPTVKANGWNQKTLQGYWDMARGYKSKAAGWLSIAHWVTGSIALISLLMLFVEGISVASVLLTIVGISLFLAVFYLRKIYNNFFASRPKLEQAFRKDSLEDLYRNYFSEDSFTGRTAIKLIGHLRTLRIEEVLMMALTRAGSAVTMISDVFLKHIRRLIYDQLFSNPAYMYRRLDNPIYRLSHTNNKNRRMPAFDEREGEDTNVYERRKEKFISDIEVFCIVTDEMQDLAELAYNAPTTLWFTPEEEAMGKENIREAIIVTGQFSTCYSLLRYTLSLRHSRNFPSLSQHSKERIDSILEQLKAMMSEFNRQPHFLYRRLTRENDN